MYSYIMLCTKSCSQKISLFIVLLYFCVTHKLFMTLVLCSSRKDALYNSPFLTFTYMLSI